MKYIPKYFPLLISLKGKRCLVVGGGRVALRKVRNLLPYSTKIFVVSPECVPKLKEIAKRGKITLFKRPFIDTDLENVDLVFIATNNENLNCVIANKAKSLNIPVNVVDDPDKCSFIIPSMIRRGPLLITISTDALYPALSKKIRKKLEKDFGKDFEKYIILIGELRDKIIKQIKDKKQKEEIVEFILNSDIFKVIKEMGKKEAKKLGEKIIKDCLKK